MNDPDQADVIQLPMRADRGTGEELRIFLEDALSIPKGARRFTVTFEAGECVVVNVEYIVHERE